MNMNTVYIKQISIERFMSSITSSNPMEPIRFIALQTNEYILHQPPIQASIQRKNFILL